MRHCNARLNASSTIRVATSWTPARRPNVGRMLPVTTALIATNVALFFLQSVAPGALAQLALWPLGEGAGFGLWQLITYGFLHGSLLHLGFNMFAGFRQRDRTGLGAQR